MSYAAAMRIGKAFWKQIVGILVVLVVLATVGLVGRDATKEQSPKPGFSVVAIKTAGENNPYDGYVPVQMHQPFARRFQPVQEVAHDESDRNRLEFNNRFSDGTVEQMAQPLILAEQSLSEKDKKKEKSKSDMFASLREKDDGILDKERTEQADDSMSWGWLADGVAEKDQSVDIEPPEQKRPSPLETSLRNDFWSGEKLGGSESAAGSDGGKRFRWRDTGAE
jgi:hypothetical protein